MHLQVEAFGASIAHKMAKLLHVSTQTEYSIIEYDKISVNSY